MIDNTKIEWARRQGKSLAALYAAATQAWARVLELEEENARLRGALIKIAAGDGIYGAQAGEYKAIAREALKETSHE